jgi:hypothetical protein
MLLLAQCTVPMPVGDTPGWHQIFTDDFTTDLPVGAFSGCVVGSTLRDSQCSGLPPAVRAKWFTYLDGWKDSSGNGTFMPSKVMSVHDGMMDLYLHTENGVHMIAAPEPKIPSPTGRGLSAGRYVVRFYMPPLPRYKAAWMLWPDSNLQTDGEINFPEGDFTERMWAFMHHQDATGPADQATFLASNEMSGWHTAATEWKPGSVTFTLDGTVIGHTTTRVPDTPMHWVLQTETTLNGQVPTATDHGHVLIDWVAVYAPS